MSPLHSIRPFPNAPRKPWLRLACITGGLAALASATPCDAQCPISMTLTSSQGTGSSPLCVAIADFNGDGRPDVAAANQLTGDVSILLGNANGTLAPETFYGTGSQPYFVAAADLNADGIPDLAVANLLSSNVSILRGNGNGTFQAAVNYTTAFGAICVVIGDFNADSHPDLAVVNQFAASVSILLGNPAPGLGTFQAAVVYPVGNGPTSAAIGDFNLDGKLDLAVANFDDNNVSVLRGNGNGTFQAAVNFPVGAGPRAIAAGNLNGDGAPDLATANYNGNSISVLRSIPASASFEPAVTTSVGVQPHSIAIGDINGDGRPDLAVASPGNNTIYIMQTSGSGGLFLTTFAAGVQNGPVSVAFADLNADGRQDLAVAHGNADNVGVLLNFGSSPLITTQPVRVNALSGQSAVFTINATGATGFQWRKNNQFTSVGVVSTSTSSTLTMSALPLADNAAVIDCLVYGACGNTTSTPVTLAVTPRCPSDFNQDGSRQPTDIFAFLNAYFAPCP